MFGIVRKRRVARPRQDCGRVPAEQRIEREAQPSSASAAELAQILLSLSLSLSRVAFQSPCNESAKTSSILLHVLVEVLSDIVTERRQSCLRPQFDGQLFSQSAEGVGTPGEGKAIENRHGWS
jgi:hypothetical protein